MMLHSMNDLMQGRLRAGGREVRADEVFFHPKDRRLRYLAIHVGGWFDIDEVIVSADLLVPPDDGSGTWTLRLDAAALEAAPRWTEHGLDAPVDMTGWPPIIVGPFGGTYAPMLLYEQMVAGRRDRKAAPADGGGDALVWRMERATGWLGIPAFGTDGELGRVDDLLFEDGTLEIARLVLGTGGRPGHKGVEVPMSRLRHMARQGTHLVLDMSSAEAEKAAP